MRVTFNQQLTTNWQQQALHGRPHIVAPVVLLTEGVHDGSGGPVFYPADELEKSAHLWNGVSLSLNHPLSNGLPVSANSPEIEEKQNVGRLYDVIYDNGKLKGKIWIDKKRAETFPELLHYLNGNLPLEVSTGLFSDDSHVSGNWNGKAYQAVVRNIKPDHLALLPGQTGACSWSDGCGVRVNAQQEEPLLVPGMRPTRSDDDGPLTPPELFPVKEKKEPAKPASDQSSVKEGPLLPPTF